MQSSARPGSRFFLSFSFCRVIGCNFSWNSPPSFFYSRNPEGDATVLLRLLNKEADDPLRSVAQGFIDAAFATAVPGDDFIDVDSPERRAQLTAALALRFNFTHSCGSLSSVGDELSPLASSDADRIFGFARDMAALLHGIA